MFSLGLNRLALRLAVTAIAMHQSGGEPVPTAFLMFGQSNMADLWQNSNYTLDGHTTNASCAISSAMWDQFPDIILSAAPITGTNIPGGDTFTTDSLGANITLSPSCATGSTTGGAIEFEFPRIGNTVGRGLRYQAGTSQVIYAVDDVPHADEGAYAITSLRATYGYPGGATAFANSMGVYYPTVLQFQIAQGGTPVCDWVSSATSTCPGAGSLYTSAITSPSTGFSHNSRGISTFSDALFLQGEYEAINVPETQAQYYENLQNISAWVQGFSGAPKFMIAIMGNLTAAVSDASADAVVQAQLQAVDTGFGLFGGNMRVVPLGGSDRHSTRAGTVLAACYMAQATLKANGKAAAGYGPRIDQASVSYDGSNILSIPVLQETGTSLRAAGQSTSGVGITGFIVKANGTPVAYTSSFSGNTIRLAIGVQTPPITVAYLSGQNIDTSNPVFDDAALTGPDCTPGLPLQPSRGPFITAL